MHTEKLDVSEKELDSLLNDRTRYFCPVCDLTIIWDKQIDLHTVDSLQLTCDGCDEDIVTAEKIHGKSGLWELETPHGNVFSEEDIRPPKEEIIEKLGNVMTDEQLEEIEDMIRKL